jgi:hypothetical protein
MLLESKTIDHLREFDLVYVGSPYSKYPGGIEHAFKDICVIMANLVRHGIKAYSPIAHTHPIAKHGHIDPLNHDVWLTFDKAIMEKCGAILVAKMETWEVSYGVNQEIVFFRNRGRPIYYLTPETMEVNNGG